MARSSSKLKVHYFNKDDMRYYNKNDIQYFLGCCRDENIEDLVCASMCGKVAVSHDHPNRAKKHTDNIAKVTCRKCLKIIMGRGMP